MAKRRNPSLTDMVSNVVVGSAVTAAKDHITGYYKKKGKQMAKKRRNPDEITTSTHHSNHLLPADEVADLLGGEYIPLKGMIVTDEAIQLIAPDGERISNPGKRRLATVLGRKTGVGGGYNKTRTSLRNPTSNKATYKVIDQDGKVRAQTSQLTDAKKEAKYLMAKLASDMHVLQGNKKVHTVRWYR